MSSKQIVTNPRIAHGMPVIQGTQITVQEILSRIATGLSLDQVADQLDGLDITDVKMALDYAATVVQKQTSLKRSTEPLGNNFESGPDSPKLDLKKILVVDDVEENRILMKHMFKSSGFHLVLAKNAQEGLEKARIELPVLVISDIQMPRMSGLDLLTALRSDDRTRNMGVILVTAHARGSQHASHGLSMGADDYIARPFMRNEFLSRVGTIVRVKWAEEQARQQARSIAQYSKRLQLVNELAVAVNSSLDLQEIFASAMQKLSEILDAEAVSLLLLKEEQQELEVNISSRAGNRVSVPFDFNPRTEVTARLIEKITPDVVTNVLGKTRDELNMNHSPGGEKITCIPMISKEQVLGAIAIVNKRSGSFSETDWVLLHSAVGIISVAVANASLLKTAQDQVDDLIVLNEIGRALTSTLDQNQILRQTTLLVQRSLQAEVASLWLLDQEKNELELITTSGYGAGIAEGYRLPVGSGIAGYVARTGEPYVSADVTRDEKFFGQVSDMIQYRPRSILAVPVRIRGHIIGVMQSLHRKAGWFDENHRRLFHSVASSVGIAVENARLFDEIQEFNRHLEQMVAERTRALSDEQEKTQAILTSMADGLLVLDAENRVLTANAVAEDMLDFKLGSKKGRHINPEDMQNPIWEQVMALVNSIDLTDTALVDMPPTQTGTFRSVQARSARVRSEAGEIIGTVIVLRDITAITEVERIKARFMAGVTHELKTPLSVIQLHSKNLLKYYDRLPDQKRCELITSIQTQVDLLERLIEDILQLARLDSNVTQIHAEPIDLRNLTGNVINALHPLAEDRQIALNWQDQGEEATVFADPDQLDRVVRNLVENAIKYTPSGGSVTVQLVTDQVDGQPLAGVRVTDTGMGIPVEHQAKIFDRFYRVDPSHTIPGTGLGLSIVREIVNAHNGNIYLESAVGKGSTFVVTLPCAEQVTV